MKPKGGLIVIIVVVAVAFGYLLNTSVAPSTTPTPNEFSATLPYGYGAEVIQVGGIGVTVNEKTAYFLDKNGYLNPPDEYVFTSFNTPRDLMWLKCRDGYYVDSCGSTTQNKINIDPDFGCGVTLKNTRQNRADIVCLKK